MSETKLAEHQPQEPVSKALITVTRKGVELTSLDEIWRFAGMVEKSGLSPKGMSREGIVVAITMGLELGLSPMAAVREVLKANKERVLATHWTMALSEVFLVANYDEAKAIADAKLAQKLEQ